MARQIVKLRRGTKEEWKQYEESKKEESKPLEGELVVEYDNGTPRLKIGDGLTAYSELPYMSIDSFITPNKTSVMIQGGNSAWNKASDNRHYQKVNVNGANITDRSKVDLQVDSKQLKVFHNKELSFVAENVIRDESLEPGVYIYCVGQIPKDNYTVQATVTEITDKEIGDRIVGNTTTSPRPKPDWNQTDESEADFIKNKPNITELIDENTVYNNSEPLLKDIGGILASEHPNGFNNVPISDIITELLYPYTEPQIDSFTMNPGAGAKEMNVELKVTSATVNVTKKSKNIESVSLYKNDVLVETKTDSITSNGTTITFDINETLDGSTDTNYQVKVTEVGGKVVSSSKQTYDFVYPYFYGVVSNGATIDSDTILTFIKGVRAKGNHNYSYTTDNQCPVIAYPKSYGKLKSIIDPNNFTQEWTQSTVNVNNGTTINGVDYYVYVGGAATATATYKFNY